MKLNVRGINRFLMFKLPAAFICGVRLKSINNKMAQVAVTYRWINQNPFNSMYFAVQSMAAELSTGSLIMAKIQLSNSKINMLVTNHKGAFTKKAIGKIIFTCNDGKKIDDAIAKTLQNGEWEKVALQSVGVDEQGDEVSQYNFEWSVRAKLDN